MNVPGWVWLATIGGLTLVLLVDLLIIGRRPHEPTFRESALWVLFYVTFAVAFGLGVLVSSGAQFGGEFFAGWLTEYSLSVDNLFVFVIIMSRFAVPRMYQQTVLLIGIVVALIMRGIFISIGVAAINAFSWVFYIFGAFLLYTAVQLARHKEETEAEYRDNAVLRWVKRRLPSTNEYHGTALTVRVNGRRLVTPMLIVMIAIGTTDLLFALDSIPAIFGLTEEAYLVFTANVFALMGLRQLYFLIGGLLDRLVYLSTGLAIILGFIGVKLILEALHKTGVEHIGALDVPEVSIAVSLSVIVIVLAVTTVASLIKSHREARAAAAAAQPEVGTRG